MSASPIAPGPADAEPWVGITSSGGFPAWLAEQGVGLADIITGPGPQGGRIVNLFRPDGTVVASFNAYAGGGGGDGWNGAVRVAFATVTGSRRS